MTLAVIEFTIIKGGPLQREMRRTMLGFRSSIITRASRKNSSRFDSIWSSRKVFIATGICPHKNVRKELRKSQKIDIAKN